MADSDTPASSDAPKKPAARRRTTTPAKAAASTRTPRIKTSDAGDPVETPARAAKAKAPPKPRSTKRATKTPAATGRTRGATKSPAKTSRAAADKAGGGWGAAAIGAGVAAIGAAAAAAFLGRRAKKDDAVGQPTAGAHQTDGADSSASFNAGIADEGSVPDKA